MKHHMQLVIAQINPLVGDILGNAWLIHDQAKKAREELQGDIIIFPELSLCGYPPEDLLLRSSILPRVEKAMDILRTCHGITLVVGLPALGQKGLENQAVVLRDGKVIGRYSKQKLPNYRVFDEKRYFTPGTTPGVFVYKKLRIGILICEDLWSCEPLMALKTQNVDLILSLNASPFYSNKQPIREHIARDRCLECHCPIVYVNQVGGQDELVFDGASFALNRDGSLALRTDFCKTGLYPLSYNLQDRCFLPSTIRPILPDVSCIYRALVLALHDYVNKNKFPGVILGLSGGIDSALTLAIATDALGPERVTAVMMPYRYTSSMSQEDAKYQAEALKVYYEIISIEKIFEQFISCLEPFFVDTAKDTTEENLQARCRGVLLMALANKKKLLVLTTGNKSEISVGYATLYGDMVGGFNPLKDISKSQVYQLAHYRNQIESVIPERVITRPPSAELAPGQLDRHTLPDYEILDKILLLYIEQDLSAEEIIATGFAEKIVYRIINMVDRNEFKRRQAAIGPRVSTKSFGKDRRYPITNGWSPGS